MKHDKDKAIRTPGRQRRPMLWIAAIGPAALLGSCAHVTTDNTVQLKGDKDNPIHIIVDVNIRVDRQLDNFFSFEDAFGGPTTKPAGK